MAAARFSSNVLENFYSPLSRGQNRNLPEPLQPELVPVRDVFKISQSNFQEWLRVWIMNVSKTNPNNKDIGRFYTRDALPVWTSFGKNFVNRPVIRL